MSANATQTARAVADLSQGVILANVEIVAARIGSFER